MVLPSAIRKGNRKKARIKTKNVFFILSGASKVKTGTT
jgi:hypothetical protein